MVKSYSEPEKTILISLSKWHSFSYLHCRPELQSKAWVWEKWGESQAHECEGEGDAAAPSFSHLSLTLANSAQWGLCRAPDLHSGQDRKPRALCSPGSKECPTINVCAPAKTGSIQSKQTGLTVMVSILVSGVILLFNAGTNVSYNKAIVSMFGILWPSGTFMAFLSYTDGFIRLRDTLAGIPPLAPLLEARCQLCTDLCLCGETLWYPGKYPPVQGSGSRQTRDLYSQTPTSPSTSWGPHKSSWFLRVSLFSLIKH